MVVPICQCSAIILNTAFIFELSSKLLEGDGFVI